MYEPERKIFESDLAESSDVLKSIAEEYARNYIGNFDYMIQVKNIVSSSGHLPDSMCRPVLNCLRLDISAEHLWDAVKAVTRMPKAPPKTTTNVVYLDRRTQRKIDLKTELRINYRFAIRKHKGPNTVTHWVKSGYCIWSLKDGVRVPELHITTFCDNSGHGKFDLVKDRPVFNDCRGCLRTIAETHLGFYQ